MIAIAHSNIPYAFVSVLCYIRESVYCVRFKYFGMIMNSKYLLSPIFSILLCDCISVVAGDKLFASSDLRPFTVHFNFCFSLKAFSMILHSSQEWINLPLGMPFVTAGHMAAHEIAFLLSTSALCRLLFWTPPLATETGVTLLTILYLVLSLSSGRTARGFLPCAISSSRLNLSTSSITSSEDVQLSFLRSLASASAMAARTTESLTFLGRPRGFESTTCVPRFIVLLEVMVTVRGKLTILATAVFFDAQCRFHQRQSECSCLLLSVG